MKRIISLFLILLAFAVSFQLGLADYAGAESIVVDVPVIVSFSNATGIDLNLRLNPLLVESAEFVRPDAVLESALSALDQDADKIKVAIASATPFSFSGTLFYLRLTLLKEAGPEDELAKLLQVKINEQVTFAAENSILLSGVIDGGLYDHAVVPDFNEGTAILDGEAFTGGTTVDEEGTHVLIVTDLNDNPRTVSFELDFAHLPDSITSGIFKVNGQNGTLSRIGIETTVQNLIAGLNEREYIKVYQGTVQAAGSTFAGTGMTARLMDGSTIVQSLTVVITGDLNGDGRITLTDYVQLKMHLLNKSKLTGAPLKAGDINGDGKISLTDYVKLKMHLLKKEAIIPMEY